MQYLYDDTSLHIFKNILYSVDPETGQPLTRVLVNVDNVKLMEFGLNHRVCNVETMVNKTDVHILDFRPVNVIQLWSLMRNVYNKWEQLHENNGRVYWPCRSQAVDLIIDGTIDTLKCLQPTRFVTEKHKLAQSLMDLLLVLTTNYFHGLLESYTDGAQFVELFEISKQKVRRIECNASDKATSFFQLFDQERYERITKKPDQNDYTCSVKQLQDAVSKSDAHRYPSNFLKKLFHLTISDVFSTHKEHVHMLLCTRYLVEDPVHCESWLQLMLAVADNRLQAESAQARLTTIVKQWKQEYNPYDRRKTRRMEERDVGDEDETETNIFSRIGLLRRTDVENGGGESMSADHGDSNQPKSVGSSGGLYTRGRW